MLLLFSSFFIINVDLPFDQVSRVSDVVSIGQQVSLMCIGQDVRGNIKLSLKATLPRPGSETNYVVEGSVPSAKEEPNIWASVEEVSDGQENQNSTSEELSGSKYEMSGLNPSTSSIPTILIRSAAECDEEEKSAAWSQNPKSTTNPAGALKSKTSCPQGDSQFSDSIISPTKNVKNSKRVLENREKESHSILKSQDGDGNKYDFASLLRTSDDLIDKMDEAKGPISAKKMKIGTKLTAKVYQIRAHGLVLDLGGGLRGMYRFEVCAILFLCFCNSRIPFCFL